MTEIERLIRDPYAIYARHVLGLKALDPLYPEPDARVMGIMLHKIAETAVERGVATDPEAITAVAERLLSGLPWPAERMAWLARVAAFAKPFAEDEEMRQENVQNTWVERKGQIDLGSGFQLRGKADRIDMLKDGSLAIYDYKSGTIPSERRIRFFDRQLLIEALMAEAGGFEGVPAQSVSHVAHIALKRNYATKGYDIGATEGFGVGETRDGLLKLLNAYLAPGRGYASRRAMEEVMYAGDYDHLARFGEWDLADHPVVVLLP